MPTIVHRPPEIIITGGPSIFLAGPIQGAPDWQAEAEVIFDDLLVDATDVHIFNPRAENLNHGKKEQIKWEKINLRHARRYGAILFWFAAQDFSIHDYPVGRAYAQTSRIEFGRAMGWKDYAEQIGVGVGIDPEYRGGNVDYIKDCAEEHAIPVQDNLKELCQYVMELCTRFTDLQS